MQCVNLLSQRLMTRGFGLNVVELQVVLPS
jgi:hypothetical protein